MTFVWTDLPGNETILHDFLQLKVKASTLSKCSFWVAILVSYFEIHRNEIMTEITLLALMGPDWSFNSGFKHVLWESLINVFLRLGMLTRPLHPFSFFSLEWFEIQESNSSQSLYHSNKLVNNKNLFLCNGVILKLEGTMRKRRCLRYICHMLLHLLNLKSPKKKKTK